MSFRVLLIESDQGFAACCPAIYGCWSQGDTEEEALEMIADAIKGLLEVGTVPSEDSGAQEEADILREAAADGARVLFREVVLLAAV